MKTKMANNEIKTNAEIYREQRKARLEKASKKKHSAKRDKITRIIVKVVTIVLCVAIVCGITGNFLLNTFHVPQKLLTMSTFQDDEVSVAEYNYYYMSLYNSIAETSYQYENAYASTYGQGCSVYFTGFDISKDPADQEYPVDEETPETVKTWADYFKEMATTRAFLINAIHEKATSEEAKKSGFEITEDKQAEITSTIDERIKSIQESATEADYALDNYISRFCGEGLTEKSYRELLEKEIIVNEYLTWYQEHLVDEYTKEDVDAYFNENKTDFVTASARIFEVSYAEPEEGSKDVAYTKEEAKQRADEFKSKITDDASFAKLAKQYAPASMTESYDSDSATLLSDVYYADVSASSEVVASWLFSDERKVAETVVLDDETAECYYIVYVVKNSTIDTSVANASVRHILISAETTDASGNNLKQDVIDKNFATAKEKAEKLMQTWKDNGATEEAFIALVADNTGDTASIQTGGLYDDVSAGSNYVPEFKNWAIAQERKPGDAELVKTEFGYHFMYFVSASEYQTWENDVRSAMASDDYNALVDGIYDDIEENAKTNETFKDFFAERIQQRISLNYI